MRVYVAGPLFTPDQRRRLMDLADAVRAAEHEPVLPFDPADAWPGPDDAAARRAAFDLCVASVTGADAVVAVLDGVDVDPGTAFEVGLAHARGTPVFGARTDYRSLGVEGPVNLMLAHGVSVLSHHPDAWDAVLEDLRAFLADPPPRPVTRLLREKDALRMKAAKDAGPVRKVEGEAYARAVKAALVATAERLAGAGDTEDEKADVAEVLELVETLIAHRAWATDGLRRVKTRLNEDRGSYRAGYVTDA